MHEHDCQVAEVIRVSTKGQSKIKSVIPFKNGYFWCDRVWCCHVVWFSKYFQLIYNVICLMHVFFHFQTLQLELTFTIVNSANGNESKILATQRFKQGWVFWMNCKLFCFLALSWYADGWDCVSNIALMYLVFRNEKEEEMNGI